MNEKSKRMRNLKHVAKILLDFKWVLCLGVLVTEVLVYTESIKRGYFAIGGEWIVAPAMLAARQFILYLMEERPWTTWLY